MSASTLDKPEVGQATPGPCVSCDAERIAKFDDMPLHSNLLRGVYSYGFEKPSEIQQRTIVPLCRGGDVIGQAQSGTGKTGAFSIGLLQRVDFRLNATQALVLSPTRELAEQTFEVIGEVGHYVAEGQPFACMFTGGTKTSEDIRRLQDGKALVAVGTPGRIADLIKRGALRVTALKCVVLDEADEMLSQGFAEQVYNIFRFLPKDVQIALFSATMPDEVLQLTTRFMRSPTSVLLEREALTLKGIKQFYVAVAEEYKLGTIIDLYESISIAQAVIFAGTRRTVDWLGRQLSDLSHTVGTMHAEMQRADRISAMRNFKRGSTRVLVTSDLMARGIDVQHVNIVINFDLPANAESYLHRIGRSGRFGRRGIAINLVSPREEPLLRELEAHYKTQIEELPANFTDHLADGDECG